MGIGMGVAMVMQQAGALVGAPQVAFDVNGLHAQIRKAKAEGRTVTMVRATVWCRFWYPFNNAISGEWFPIFRLSIGR